MVNHALVMCYARSMHYICVMDEKREPKSVSLTIRIRQSTKDMLDEQAKAADRSNASYIERLIRRAGLKKDQG